MIFFLFHVVSRFAISNDFLFVMNQLRWHIQKDLNGLRTKNSKMFTVSLLIL